MILTNYIEYSIIPKSKQDSILNSIIESLDKGKIVLSMSLLRLMLIYAMYVDRTYFSKVLNLIKKSVST